MGCFREQRVELAGVGAGDPGLRADGPDFLEQGLPSPFVEMGGYVVEQENRRESAMRGQRAQVGEHDGDQEGFLLSGGA